jgi:anti-sigma-K factor RskA
MDADLFRRARRAPSLRWRLLTLVSIAAVVILGLSASLSYRRAKQPPAQGRRAPCAAEEIRVHHLPSLLPS